MNSFAIYIATAVAEIGGCFAFWAWLRLGKSVYWVLGRSYAAYGGVYISASLLWLWIVEGQYPDRWDILGGIICLAGAAVILFGPRVNA